jgi:hypothetical protein
MLYRQFDPRSIGKGDSNSRFKKCSTGDSNACPPAIESSKQSPTLQSLPFVLLRDTITVGVIPAVDLQIVLRLSISQ